MSNLKVPKDKKTFQREISWIFSYSILLSIDFSDFFVIL